MVSGEKRELNGKFVIAFSAVRYSKVDLPSSIPSFGAFGGLPSSLRGEERGGDSSSGPTRQMKKMKVGEAMGLCNQMQQLYNANVGNKIKNPHATEKYLVNTVQQPSEWASANPLQCQFYSYHGSPTFPRR